MKAARLIVPGAVLGVVALLGYGLLRPAGDPPNMLLGKAAPDFTLRDTSGRAQTLSAYRGQPVVVNFWASWCEPCRQEAPMFSRVSRELSGKVPFLGLLYNDQPSLADTFSQQYGLTYPTVLDPGSRTAIKYGIGQVPVTYIVDTKGTIVYHHLGPVLDEAEFRAALQKAGARL